MYKWIKNLVDAYDKMFVIETAKDNLLFTRVGNKKIYQEQESKQTKPVGKVTIYVKKEEE